MYFAAESLDDLLLKVYKHILARGIQINPTKGPAREIHGVLLKLSVPRSRLSRTESRGILFSCIGELAWILAGSNKLDFIQHYLQGYGAFSDDHKTIFGAYGPRLFGKRPNDQIERVIAQLKLKQDSRQAVVQLFDRTDILETHLDVPCTCTLQFLVRDDRLHMLTSMRSNDAWLGLPHDVFTFTMIQELIARSLGIKLGTYKHAVGSLHLYDKHQGRAIRYLEEGWQPRRSMRPMPHGDPWEAVKSLVVFEDAIRTASSKSRDPRDFMSPYWADLANLLAIYKASKTPNNQNELRRLQRRLNDDVYSMYFKRRLQQALSEGNQLSIFDDKKGTTKETK